MHMDAVLPTRKHPQDAGIDFYSIGPVIIEKDTTKVVRTGVCVQIPDGWFGLMKPKGSANFLIGAGVVDAGYQGEILFKVVNTSGHDISFLPGQPVGQMVLIPVATPELEEISYDDFRSFYTDRGTTGGIHGE
jgi:dUTP pyrophosphatase